MDRREFIKILLGGGAGLIFDRTYARPLRLLHQRARYLPPPQVNTFSSEMIMNSRRSYHGGYNGALSDQILANALWAASRAPVIGTDRTIYTALPDNVYEYDPLTHDIILHLAGNHLSESNLAFEIGVASDLAEDAGASLHYAHLASTSFWTATSSQPSCCPKESARNNANNTWNPSGSIQIANCYGLMATVSGVSSQLVAISSNASLPDPTTDGTILLENALANLHYGSQFLDTELTLEQLSQIAWSSYGNTPHITSNNRAGLTAASAVANYYLTGRIYMVRSEGVDRYHVRLPSGQPSTRDHRIERVTDGDCRAQLRSAVPRISQTAPNYFVFCAATADRWQLIEAGYCAAGALLQSTSIDLQGHFTSGFSSIERTAIINALGIPSADLPLLVFSVGQEYVGVGENTTDAAGLLSISPNPFSDNTVIRWHAANISPMAVVSVSIYDATGRLVKSLYHGSGISVFSWDGTDQRGRRAPRGNYYVTAIIGSREVRQKITKIR